jgi:hypothetical protein
MSSISSPVRTARGGHDPSPPSAVTAASPVSEAALDSNDDEASRERGAYRTADDPRQQTSPDIDNTVQQSTRGELSDTEIADEVAVRFVRGLQGHAGVFVDKKL